MSATYADRRGRRWDLFISVDDLPFLKERGFDLSDPAAAAARALELAEADPARLVEALYHLCGEPARELDVSPKEFARGLGGWSLRAAAEALAHAVIDFFPNPTVAAELRSVLTGLLAEARARAAAGTSSGSAGRPPESPASTPAPSASDS